MNKGILLAVGLCCVWPVIFHLIVTYGLRYIRERDWQNIRWDGIKFPWSQEK